MLWQISKSTGTTRMECGPGPWTHTTPAGRTKAHLQDWVPGLSPLKRSTVPPSWPRTTTK
eukprot:5357876-Heterocapsa_arctica.AAC.1